MTIVDIAAGPFALIARLEEELAPDATEPRDRRGSRGSEVRMGRSPVGGADRDDHLASARFSRMRAALPWRSRM